MFNDVGLFISDDGTSFDVKVENGDLVADNGLETAVLISLYTDKLAEGDELRDGVSDRRGWWGDMFPDVDQDQIGSKLWLLDGEKQTSENLVKAEGYAQGALQWLIDDGVASDILVAASYPGRGQLGLEIQIQKPDGEDSKFGFIWDGQSLKRI